jgi:hypothetical protein
MPRVVPSDVVAAVDRLFPDAVAKPEAASSLYVGQAPAAVAVVRLVEAIPGELLDVLTPDTYAELLASTAYLSALPAAFQAVRARDSVLVSMQGFARNPFAMIRAAMAACPDEAPAAGTALLGFIGDPELRESIRLDLSAATRDLSAGEWKGATVLAGAATEALLLWALQEHEAQHRGALATATGALVAAGTLRQQPTPKPEEWVLHTYVEVAAHCDLIRRDAATLVRLAKDYRNLIHPGRAQRRGQKCDRPTALAALAAALAVARDLTP